MSKLAYVRLFILIAGAAASAGVHATYHLWQITQVYSNADSTVQFIELVARAAGQQSISGHTITSTQGAAKRSFTFPTNLPGNSADGEGGYYGTDLTYRSFLIGTPGFAALNLVKPDYVVSSGFLFLTNGVVNFAESADIFVYPVLPTTGGLALNRSGSTAVGLPLNFAGDTAKITATPAATAPMALENPQPGSYQSGIGLISGWSCEGSTISVAIDGAAQRSVPYGSGRGDTASICGAANINTGFGLLFNYNGLGNGTHTAQIFVNGTARGTPVSFTVTAPSGEFLSGATKQVTVQDFPTAGKTSVLVWQESQQNFAIKLVTP